MHLQLSAPNAAALTLWSCFGCAILLMFPARTDAAWSVALATLFGQFLMVKLVSVWRARQVH